MSRDTPEQLQLEFGRSDPTSEQYPRRHDFRQTTTTREFLANCMNTSVDFVSKTRARRITGLLCLLSLNLAVFTGEDNEESQTSVPVAESLADCSNGVNPNLEDLQYVEDYDYAELYDRIALFDLESWGNLRAEQIFANGIGAKEAADKLDSYLEGGPVKINYDIDWAEEEKYSDADFSYNAKINRAGIENLAIAMYSIPKTLYEYAGIKEIKIVEELKYLKSEEQLLQERKKAIDDPDTVDKYYHLGGQYWVAEGIVLLPKESLTNSSELMKTLFHEVIGHGVMMTNCEPHTDSDWQDLNLSTGIGFSYTPEWKQTPEVVQLFNSGILVNGSYAGKNPREDVAETSILLAPAYPQESLFYGQVLDQNGTILDEKTKLIFDRVSEIEPDFGRFLALQYELALLTASGSYDELLDTIGHKGLLQ